MSNFTKIFCIKINYLTSIIYKTRQENFQNANQKKTLQ
jgi:hypothetical protein